MSEKRKLEPQVEKTHYSVSYDTKERFSSYWTQIQLVHELSCPPVLEIGIGNKFVNDYLKKTGVEVSSVDIAADLSPDVVASVLDMPFENDSFGTAMACQVLEHIPFELFPKALAEIRRITKRYVLISLPNAARAFPMMVTIPKVGKRQWLFDLSNIPRRKQYVPDGEHYWEIGWRGYPLKRITSVMEQVGFTVLKNRRSFEFPYHHFFVLEKS